MKTYVSVWMLYVIILGKERVSFRFSILTILRCVHMQLVSRPILQVCIYIVHTVVFIIMLIGVHSQTKYVIVNKSHYIGDMFRLII
jgi:hypothetical protein